MTQGRHIGRLPSIVLGLALGAAACGAPGAASESGPEYAGGGPRTQVAHLESQYPIVFHSDRGGLETFRLYVMTPGGGGRDAIAVTNADRYFQPRWSPDGRSIAFRLEIEGAKAEVGLIAMNDGQRVTLTAGEDAGLRNRAPAWSDDGERIAFDSMRGDAGPGIWVVSRLGGPAQRLMPDLNVEHREVAWSPDGSRIAYSARLGESRQRDLFVAEIEDPAAAVNLTEGRAYAPTFLRWSPDGSRIAFASAAVQGDGSPEPASTPEAGGYAPPDSEIFVSEVETRVLTRLTDNGEIDLEPAWAPDGQSLIFTRGSIEAAFDADLWIMPLNAPETAHSLIDDDDDEPAEEGGADWYWPRP